MTKVILSRADEVVKKFPFPRAPKNSDTTLFIAGHGTEKNENSRKAIERQVELIRAQKIYADVHAIFLEESPRIADCYSNSRKRKIWSSCRFSSATACTRRKTFRFCSANRNAS